MNKFNFKNFLSTKQTSSLVYKEENKGSYVKFFIYKAGVQKLASLDEDFKKLQGEKSSATFKTYTATDTNAFREFLKTQGFVLKQA